MALSEAVARFRSLDEAVKVGDYVYAPVAAHAWMGGHVVGVQGDKVSFQWSDHGDTKTEWIPKSKITSVNPGGSPH